MLFYGTIKFRFYYIMKPYIKSILRRKVLKIKRNFFDYLSVLKYTFMLLFFVIFNRLGVGVLPYSIAPFFAFLSQGASLIVTPILFIGSFLFLGEVGLLLSAGCISALSILITFLHKNFSNKINASFMLYCILLSLIFVIVGNTEKEILMIDRSIVAVVCVILSFLCYYAIKAVNEKGLKFKFGLDELACIIILAVLFGVGISNFLSPAVWKGLCVFIILLTAFTYRLSYATILSGALGISLSIFYGNLNYVSVFLVWGLTIECLIPLNRHLAVIGVLLVDFLIGNAFGVYATYDISQIVPLAIGALTFSLIPYKPLCELKEKLYSFREKQLSRQAINRNRLMVSNRLYELSTVFTEMAGAFTAFCQNDITEESAKARIEHEIYNTVCKNCELYNRCISQEFSIKRCLSKMTDIGFAKGKLSLIDLSKEMTDICFKPNNIIYGINKLLAEYRQMVMDNANVASGRELIASEVSGVAEVLRALAVETGGLLKYQSRIERALFDKLSKSGFMVSEILVYGEEERLSVGLIITMKEFSISQLEMVISSALGANMRLADKNDFSDDKCFLTFTKACDYDAVFGIAKAKKDGSEISGDTHSVTRILDDKFLVALSDGMGSGKKAEAVSNASLSLIESFYKAGLNSSLILNTVNRLLAINTEEIFTALDISVINLKNCSADFIKYGSPYSFIIGAGGIKIVEGNSLPLGIIDKLNPSVCHTTINDGDVILLLTDGVSDAFGSSGEMIDFLRTVPAKNPQTLANEILERAIELNGGKHNDDMSALAVRVFKKTAI